MISHPMRVVRIALFFLLTSYALYGSSIWNGFVFDDNGQIVENGWIRSFQNLPTVFSSGVWNFREFHGAEGYWYRPMMHAIFMLEYHMFRLNPAGYHAVNIALHTLNALLISASILAFLRTNNGAHNTAQHLWGGQWAFAILTAFIFVIHPANSETVEWISAIPELSYTFFFLLAILFFILSENEKSLRFISMACFAIALCCKETAVMLPIFLGAYVFFFQGVPANNAGWRSRSIASLRSISPYLPLLLVYLIIRWNVLDSGSGLSILWTKPIAFILISIFLAAELLAENILTLLYPYHLSIFHIQNGKIFLGSSLFILLPLILFIHAHFRNIWKNGWKNGLRPNDIVLFGGLMFLIPILPALNFFFLGDFALSERYLYLPSAGFSMIIAFITLKILGLIHQINLRVFVAILLATFSIGTAYLILRERTSVWHDDISLFSDAVKKSPGSGLAKIKLAEAYCLSGDVEQCDEQYTAYCELTNAIPSEKASCKKHLGGYHRNIGNAYYIRGDFSAAALHYAMDLKSSDGPSAETSMDLGLAYYHIGQMKLSERYLEDAVDMDASSSQAKQNLKAFRCLQNPAASVQDCPAFTK